MRPNITAIQMIGDIFSVNCLNLIRFTIFTYSSSFTPITYNITKNHCLQKLQTIYNFVHDKTLFMQTTDIWIENKFDASQKEATKATIKIWTTFLLVFLWTIANYTNKTCDDSICLCTISNWTEQSVWREHWTFVDETEKIRPIIQIIIFTNKFEFIFKSKAKWMKRP